MPKRKPKTEEDFIAMPLQERTDFLNGLDTDERSALFDVCGSEGRRAFNECPIKSADTVAAEAAQHEADLAAEAAESEGENDDPGNPGNPTE